MAESAWSVQRAAAAGGGRPGAAGDGERSGCWQSSRGCQCGHRRGELQRSNVSNLLSNLLLSNNKLTVPLQRVVHSVVLRVVRDRDFLERARRGRRVGRRQRLLVVRQVVGQRVRVANAAVRVPQGAKVMLLLLLHQADLVVVEDIVRLLMLLLLLLMLLLLSDLRDWGVGPARPTARVGQTVHVSYPRVLGCVVQAVHGI
jgi:hypothetical protein